MWKYCSKDVQIHIFPSILHLQTSLVSFNVNIMFSSQIYPLFILLLEMKSVLLKWNTNLMQHCAGFISAESLYMFRAQAPIIRSI